jgi:hypothetical protein
VAIKDKAVKDDPIKTLLTDIAKFRDGMNKLSERRLSNEFVVPELTESKLDEIHKIINEHVTDTSTSNKPSKLSEYETKSDLIELWSTLKLVDSLMVGLETKSGFLGI